MTKRTERLNKLILKSKVKNENQLIAVLELRIGSKYSIVAKSQYFHDLFKRFGESEETINGFRAFDYLPNETTNNTDFQKYHEYFNKYQNTLFNNTSNTVPNLSFLRAVKINEGIEFNLNPDLIYTTENLKRFIDQSSTIIKQISSEFKTDGNLTLEITTKKGERILKWL